MDAIRLNGIEVLCIIGERPDEREREQRLVVDVELGLDLAQAMTSDDLADTIDYAALSRRVRDSLRTAKCRMLERAAGVVVEVCRTDPRVKAVAVAVRKFGSVAGLASAEVRISRP